MKFRVGTLAESGHLVTAIIGSENTQATLRNVTTDIWKTFHLMITGSCIGVCCSQIDGDRS